MPDELSEIGALTVTGQDLRLHTSPSHFQHNLGLLHLKEMHTAESPQTPEQHLGSGSGRLRHLPLTEGHPGVGEVGRATSTRNSLSTGRTVGGRDRRLERGSTRGVRSWGSTSLGTEGCRGQEVRGQRRIRPKEGNPGLWKEK